MPDSDKPDIVILPPLAALFGVFAYVVLHFVWRFDWLPGFPSLPMIIVGGLLVIGGFKIAFSAARQFQGADTNVDPTKPALVVVKTGPYRFTRNPMYVGLLSVHLGLGLALSFDWVLIITPILWAVLHWGVVLREETYLTEKFGVDYSTLLSSTRRWF